MIYGQPNLQQSSSSSDLHLYLRSSSEDVASCRGYCDSTKVTSGENRGNNANTSAFEMSPLHFTATCSYFRESFLEYYFFYDPVNHWMMEVESRAYTELCELDPFPYQDTVRRVSLSHDTTILLFAKKKVGLTHSGPYDY